MSGSPHHREFLAGGGEMGALMRAMDWSQTPIGPVEGWSQTLRSMLSFLLANRFPLLLWWGPEFCQLYNDPYRPVLGTKHPSSMGQPARECWPEIWHIIGPLIDTPFNGGPATWMEDLPLDINRHGFVEETHFTVAYSPVPDETAPRGIGGVLATVHEVTEKVVGERRVVILRDLGACAGQARSAEEASAMSLAALANHAKDVPFALLYLIDREGGRADLAGAVGVGRGEEASPLSLPLDPQAIGGAWPLAEALQREKMVVVEDLAGRFTRVPPGPWPDPPQSAVIVPVRSNRAHQLAGLLVAGVSHRLRLDNFYRSFFELMAAQIATTIANARAYEEERKRAEALAEIDRAKTAFFSNVSHEFRTPLTLTLAPLEDLLAKSKQNELGDDRLLLEVAHRNAMRLLRLVNTLLDFSRIEAGRVQASYEPADLAGLTAELVGNFRSACERAGLSLTVDCTPLDEPAYVDLDMWEKIVLNLVSNAFKYTLEGGITVRLRAVDRTVVLSVEDTGCGIPEQEIPRVFERFHRIEGARGRTHEGTGIGLALVHELVKLHGGSVAVESVYGNGSRFTVSLPLGAAHLPADRVRAERPLASTAVGARSFVEEALRWLPAEEAAAADDGWRDMALLAGPPLPAARSGTRRATILLADDNADMRDYLRRLLSGRYEVDAVSDGEAALLALQRGPRPDLVLSDIMMPRLDGLGLLRAVRADPMLADLPVILLSARAGEEASIEGLEAGADDYLVKPFSARELAARVAATLEMARLRSGYREAVQSALAAEERLRAALGASGTGTYRWELPTRVAESDAALNRLFGFPEKSRGRRRLAEFVSRVHPEDRARVVAHIDKCAREGADFEMEFRIAWPDGTVRWLYNRGKMFRDNRGRPDHIAGACVDITERKRTEAALRELNETLERRIEERTQALQAEMMERRRVESALHQVQRLEAVGQVTGGVAHDFNNLLMIIGGNLELLKLQRGDPDRIIGRIEEAIARGESLTRQLLSFSRRQAVQPAVLDPSSWTPKLLEWLRPSLRGDISVTTEVAGDVWPIEVDPGELELALLNIAVNARDAMPRGGQIRLRIHNERLSGGQDADGLSGDFVRIAVSDTGVGIPADVLPKVFEPFFTTKEVGKGTGLGLSQVHGFARQAGGAALIDSVVGAGTTVTLFLPRSRSPILSAELETTAQVPHRASGTVLLVDDNDDVAEVTAGMLEGLGYRAIRVNSPLQALEYLEGGGAADLLLTDIVMPGERNGMDLARIVRERYPGLPVLLSTGYSAAAREAAGEGFTILSKPYRKAALERFIRAALDRQRQIAP